MTRLGAMILAIVVRVWVAAWVVVGVPESWAQNITTSPTTGRWMAGTTLQQRREANALFEDGNKLMDELAFADADKKYRAAIEKWNHPAFHFNRAIAQINLLQPIEAYRSIMSALKYGDAPFSPEKYKRALDYKETLDRTLAHVNIVCQQQGVVVTLDGKFLFTGPGGYQDVIRPGTHQLVATMDGYITETRDLVGDAGETSEIEVRLRPTLRIQSTRRWARWKPWTVVASGAVALGVSGFLDWNSSQQFADYDSQLLELCPAPDGCPMDEIPIGLSNTLSSARSQQWGARISYGVAGIALATGAVLLYLNQERLITVTDDSETTPTVSTATLIPVVSRNSWSVQARILF